MSSVPYYAPASAGAFSFLYIQNIDLNTIYDSVKVGAYLMAKKKRREHERQDLSPEDLIRLKPELEKFTELFIKKASEFGGRFHEDTELSAATEELRRKGVTPLMMLEMGLGFEKIKTYPYDCKPRVEGGEVVHGTFTKGDRKLGREMKIVIP